MKYANGEKVFQGFAQLVFPVEAIQHKKDPDADGNRINQYLKDEFVVDLKVPGSVYGKVTQRNDSGKIEEMKNGEARN